jgi:hypothetical protein
MHLIHYLNIIKHMFNISKQLEIYGFLRHVVPLRADTSRCKKTDLSPVHRCQKLKQLLHPSDDYALFHI